MTNIVFFKCWGSSKIRTNYCNLKNLIPIFLNYRLAKVYKPDFTQVFIIRSVRNRFSRFKNKYAPFRIRATTRIKHSTRPARLLSVKPWRRAGKDSPRLYSERFGFGIRARRRPESHPRSDIVFTFNPV